jgi:adenosylhomocysteinase
MDMSFANQALCAEFMLNHADELEQTVYNVPQEIDEEIAQLKLRAMGIQIDVLTPEQEEYLSSWEAGT